MPDITSTINEVAESIRRREAYCRQWFQRVKKDLSDGVISYDEAISRFQAIEQEMDGKLLSLREAVSGK